jgi:hypothetical protein
MILPRQARDKHRETSKNRAFLTSEAELPTSAPRPSNGVGDTLVKLDGRYLSRNCDNPGLSRPAALVLGGGGHAAHFEVLQRGQDVADGDAENVIAASPVRKQNATFWAILY